MGFKSIIARPETYSLSLTQEICQGIKLIASDIWQWVVDEISPSASGIDLITYTGELAFDDGRTADLIIDIGVKTDRMEGGDRGEWVQEFHYRGVTIHHIRLYDNEGGKMETNINIDQVEKELDKALEDVV